MRSWVPAGKGKTVVVSKSLVLTLLSFLLVSTSFFPSRAQKVNKRYLSQVGVDSQCDSNLKRIYMLIKSNLHHTAGALGFPANLDEIHLLARDPNPFICPGDREIRLSEKRNSFVTSYEIVNDPLKPKLSSMPPDRVAIIAEKRPNHSGKRFVLFYDGSVRAFDESQFDKLKNNSFIDTQTADKDE